MTRVFDVTTRPPTKTISSNKALLLPAVAAAANGTVEFPVFTARHTVIVENVRLTPQGAINVTDQTTAAVAFLNRYRGNVKIGYDGSFGAIPLLKAGAPLAATLTPIDAPSGAGFAWVGYLSAAVTAAVSTGGTVVNFGSSSLSGLVESTAILNGGTMSMVVDPGTAAEETISISAYNTGTGVFTIAAAGTFANSHVAGALVVLRGALLWAGTSTAATAGVSTGTTLTAIAPSLLTTRIAVGSQLIFEPFTSNSEVVPVGTLNTGTGAFTIATSYNGGVFIKSHANGATVGILMQAPLQLLKGEVLTLKWIQSATTGLALPASSLLEIDLRPAP